MAPSRLEQIVDISKDTGGCVFTCVCVSACLYLFFHVCVCVCAHAASNCKHLEFSAKTLSKATLT